MSLYPILKLSTDNTISITRLKIRITIRKIIEVLMFLTLISFMAVPTMNKPNLLINYTYDIIHNPIVL